MDNERKWIAVAGRLDMKSFLYWVAVANALFILTVGVSALVVYLGMKLGFAFWAVRAASILIFGAVIFFGGRILKKTFNAKRSDLCFEMDHERIVFTKESKKFGETSLNDEFEFLTGIDGEMGLGFPTRQGIIYVGCVHQTMSWREGTQGPIHFELEPSDFIRLVGELGLEDLVQRRTD